MGKESKGENSYQVFRHKASAAVNSIINCHFKGNKNCLFWSQIWAQEEGFRLPPFPHLNIVTAPCSFCSKRIKGLINLGPFQIHYCVHQMDEGGYSQVSAFLPPTTDMLSGCLNYSIGGSAWFFFFFFVHSKVSPKIHKDVWGHLRR